MDKEKQIDEMVKEICHSPNCEVRKNCGTCYKFCKAYIYAFRAISAGYSKTSEIARKVLDELERRLYSVSHRETSIMGYVYSVVDIDEIAYEVEELKKKYTESEDRR